MSKTDAKDRRVHTRFDREIQLQGTPEEGGAVARMVARNLSMGGLYCSSTADFPEMTRLAVRMNLPENGSGNGSGHELAVEAVVVRREAVPSASGAPRYELALFFTGLEPQAREKLARYLGEN